VCRHSKKGWESLAYSIEKQQNISINEENGTGTSMEFHNRFDISIIVLVFKDCDSFIRLFLLFLPSYSLSNFVNDKPLRDW
jgi:hypothetical protein